MNWVDGVAGNERIKQQMLAMAAAAVAEHFHYDDSVDV